MVRFPFFGSEWVEAFACSEVATIVAAGRLAATAIPALPIRNRRRDEEATIGDAMRTVSIGVFMIRLSRWRMRASAEVPARRMVQAAATTPGNAARWARPRPSATCAGAVNRFATVTLSRRQFSSGIDRIIQTPDRILAQQRGLVADCLDIGDADEAKPPVEIARLEIDAVVWRNTRREDATGINDRRLFAVEQSEISLRRIEPKQESRLRKDVDVELEPIRNAPVPHWHAEDIVISRLEPFGDFDDPVPSRTLGAVEVANAKEGQFGGGAVAVEFR